MPPHVDLTGKKFSRWTILKKIGVSNCGTYEYECLCTCGKTKVVTGRNITNGKSKSCGCLHHELLSKLSYRHGKYGIPEHKTWIQMKGRCYNKKNKCYKHYGGRGIFMCDSWKNSFEEFYSDMGKKPLPELSIERIDNDKGYCKSNCKWATSIEQANNKRTSIKNNKLFVRLPV